MSTHRRREHEREGRPVRATVVHTATGAGATLEPGREQALRAAAEAVASTAEPDDVDGAGPPTWAAEVPAPPGTTLPRTGQPVATVRAVVAAPDEARAAQLLGISVDHLRSSGGQTRDRRDVLRTADCPGTVLIQLQPGGFYLDRDDPRPVLRRLALGIATEAHRGAVDKVGRPYIEHPMAVAEGLDDPIEEAVALLHDTVEDTDLEVEDLRAGGLPEEVVLGVDAISRRPKEQPEAYLRRVAACPQARNPKRKDIDHNSDPARLARIEDEATRLRLARKYVNHRRILEEAIAAEESTEMRHG